MIEVVLAILTGIGLCVISFEVGHRYGHRCERKMAEKAMRGMQEALYRAMEREMESRQARVSPWN